MKLRRNFSLVTSVGFTLAIAVFAWGYEKTRPSSSPRAGGEQIINVNIASGGGCQSRETTYEWNDSSCQLPVGMAQQMRRLCATTLSKQRRDNISRKIPDFYLRDEGHCDFVIDTRRGAASLWVLNTYDFRAHVGLPPIYGSTNASLSNNLVGAGCEKFGNVVYSCKFTKAGNCVNPVFESKNNISGFRCMDNVQY